MKKIISALLICMLAAVCLFTGCSKAKGLKVKDSSGNDRVLVTDENGKPGKARPKPALSEYACPVCGKPLVKRSGAKGEFYGCSGYPGCKKTWPVAPNGAPDFNAKKRGK